MDSNKDRIDLEIDANDRATAIRAAKEKGLLILSLAPSNDIQFPDATTKLAKNKRKKNAPPPKLTDQERASAVGCCAFLVGIGILILAWIVSSFFEVHDLGAILFIVSGFAIFIGIISLFAALPEHTPETGKLGQGGAKLELLAGDFSYPSTGYYEHGHVILKSIRQPILGERIHASKITKVELVTQENIKRLAGTLGWAFLGTIVLGPIGTVAGAVFGGRATQVRFIAEFEDGRKFLACTDSKTYADISFKCTKSGRTAQ